MPKKIRQLKVLEGSLVDNPANPGARVLLYKNADDLAKDAKTFNETVEEQNAEDLVDEAMRGIHRSIWALRQSITSIMSDDEVDDRPALINQSVDQFRAAMAASLGQLKKDGSMPKQTDDDLAARLEELEKQVGELTKVNGDLEKRAKDAEAERDELKKAAAETTPKDDEPDKDALLKGLPKALRLEIEDMRKRDQAREAEVAKLTLERAEEQAIAKVEREWPNLGKAYKLGPIYRKISKALEAEELAELEAVFKQHGEFARIAQSALGRTGNGASTVEAEVAQKAADVRKSNPNMSEAAARAKVWEEDPDLAARYRAEQH